MKRHRRQTLWLAPVLLWMVGCSGGPDVEMIPVRGTVKFPDGTVPQGERAEVIFEPVAGGTNQLRKMAFGQIQPDGSFEMMTVAPGDGVIAGKYKVIFEVHKKAMDLESLVAEEYTKPEKTPIEVVVESGAGPFDFEVKKP